MGVKQRNITDESKFILPASDEVISKLKKATKCKNNKAHIIDGNIYWGLDSEDEVYCTKCEFRFLKGHARLLPTGTIEVRDKTRKK